MDYKGEQSAGRTWILDNKTKSVSFEEHVHIFDLAPLVPLLFVTFVTYFVLEW